ncbi:Zn-ribbon domain-containing OB-fold protein [Streptomyces sp. NBC_00063]|uniref:Zn-ribbon domain-containing OB-fold protein n=1 Tax=Streptomyces sp. NBC_00063 TaxID=2975638 RepID=UPI003D7079F4
MTATYWQATARHELMIMRCTDCGEFRHPPTEKCESCESLEVAWEKLSGYGRIYSFTIVHRLLVPGFSDPYIVVLVNPIETRNDTVRIVSNFRGERAFETVRIGLDVAVEFEDVSPEITLPYFVEAPLSPMFAH